MGWTTRNKFKDAPEDAHYHNLLTTMLAEYYPDLTASVKYYCAEHKHTVEATYWKTNVIITAWNNTDQSQDVVTTHSHRSRRASAYDSMEDAVQEAYPHYHDRRFEDMQDNRYRYLPRYDPVENHGHYSEAPQRYAGGQRSTQGSKSFVRRRSLRNTFRNR
jgi:hypothetical protein